MYFIYSFLRYFVSYLISYSERENSLRQLDQDIKLRSAERKHKREMKLLGVEHAGAVKDAEAAVQSLKETESVCVYARLL